MNQLSVIQQTKINKNEKIKELSLGLKVEIVEKILEIRTPMEVNDEN